LPVCRAFALDAARHLSIANRYPAFLARPDRWRSWWFGAIPAGLALVRRFAPHVLWSTYPIATAHAIGHTLHRATGLPWIADFRDPMLQPDYPRDPKMRESFRTIETRAARRASRLVFTTPGARRMYSERYPMLESERLVLIENGYDEETFTDSEDTERAPLNPGALTLLHSGIVYRDERDPSQLMGALRRLLDAGTIAHDTVRIRFRAPVHDARLRELAAAAGVEPLIEILPPIDYRDSLIEMQRADALLVLQAANCNAQIPAKVYEYLRARRPILALTDPAGDTARTLVRVGFDAIAPLDDEAAIADLIGRFVRDPTSARLPSDAVVARQSRHGRTADLAAVLDGLSDYPVAMTRPSRLVE
jgi:glycosyltransferase involved in cell wall biosynthesis